MTGRVTILEGPDGAGKTTLANFLLLYNPKARAVHLGPHKGDPLKELAAHLKANRGDVVFDRFHLGEQVYGPVYRGKDGLGESKRRVIETALRMRHAVVVIALPPYAVAHANWARRKADGGEMFPSPSGFRSVYDRYLTVKTGLPVVMYDYTLEPDAWVGACVAIELARIRAYENSRGRKAA